MKVFLSWSGEMSKQVASALNKWLPYILQPVCPWLSSEIPIGDAWVEVLDGELKDAEYGIICLTKSNVSKPWLNFESGVLARKFLDGPSLTPFLFNIDSADLTGPLSQFQCACYSEDGVLKLIRSINKRLGPASIDDTVVRAAFDIWWKDLKGELDSISANSQEETQTAYPWLYTFEDLTFREEKKGITAIWIITDDLARHATKYEMRQKLIANVNKGVEYRFFVPEDTMIPADLQELKESNKGLLDYRSFETKDFRLHAATDYIVVNPKGPLQIESFFRLPVEGREELWVKVDETSAIKFRDRFDAYWKSGKPFAHSAAV